MQTATAQRSTQHQHAAQVMEKNLASLNKPSYQHNGLPPVMNESDKRKLSDTKRLYESYVDRIYARLTAMYGRAFTSVQGNSATDEDGKLTTIAETWYICIRDLNEAQLANGFKRLLDLRDDDYGMTAKKFRNLCLQRDDVPTLQQVIDGLAQAPYRQGTVAQRFKHPLILAISLSNSFDSFAFNTMTHDQAKKHVSALYERFLKDGWEEFKPEHFETQIAIEKTLLPEELAALEEEKQRKAELAKQAREQLHQFNRVVAEEKAVEKVKMTEADNARYEQMKAEMDKKRQEVLALLPDLLAKYRDRIKADLAENGFILVKGEMVFKVDLEGFGL